VLVLHGAAMFAMDVEWPQLRDPEYGRRIAHLRERVAEHPDRPLVLVVGGSRVAMGVKPDAWESRRPGTSRDPLLFNLSAVGAGPITQLLMVERLIADGFRPAAMVLEYWPPMLRQDGRFSEASSIDPRRLRWSDRMVICNYFPAPEKAEQEMWRSRVNVFSVNRQCLLAQALPDWFPRARHVDRAWAELDGWGWLPGMAPEDAATRRRLTEHQRPAIRARLNGCEIHPDSDRALRAIVALAREHGIAVGFLYLPESSEFRSWYPPKLEEAARRHLDTFTRTFGTPVIDARSWMDDRDLADGFHLSRVGAASFSAKLGPVLSGKFPAVGGKP
jgi:hypothetical protein